MTLVKRELLLVWDDRELLDQRDVPLGSLVLPLVHQCRQRRLVDLRIGYVPAYAAELLPSHQLSAHALHVKAELLKRVGIPAEAQVFAPHRDAEGADPRHPLRPPNVQVFLRYRLGPVAKEALA